MLNIMTQLKLKIISVIDDQSYYPTEDDYGRYICGQHTHVLDDNVNIREYIEKYGKYLCLYHSYHRNTITQPIFMGKAIVKAKTS